MSNKSDVDTATQVLNVTFDVPPGKDVLLLLLLLLLVVVVVVVVMVVVVVVVVVVAVLIIRIVVVSVPSWCPTTAMWTR